MHLAFAVEEREADRYHQCRYEVGEEGVGGHLFEVASELLRYDRSSRCTRTDDARE